MAINLKRRWYDRILDRLLNRDWCPDCHRWARFKYISWNPTGSRWHHLFCYYKCTHCGKEDDVWFVEKLASKIEQYLDNSKTAEEEEAIRTKAIELLAIGIATKGMYT